jgi:hypothetical protein
VVDVDIQFCVFFGEIVEKQDDSDQIVHKYDESVQIMILYDYPEQ